MNVVAPPDAVMGIVAIFLPAAPILSVHTSSTPVALADAALTSMALTADPVLSMVTPGNMHHAPSAVLVTVPLEMEVLL